MTPGVSRLVCAGCGAEPPRGAPYPFRCPNADAGDDVDHVLRRELSLPDVAFPAAGRDESPFVRFRTLLHAYHAGRDGGLSDTELVALIHDLDARIAEVDGHGFSVTPFARSDALSDALGFTADGGVWVKDETGNVSGSHKARHLFGVLLWLEVVERLRLTGGTRPDLAIASCGNAALAAAVVAAAGERTLRVFVPVDADEVVLERLEQLGADITTCPRSPGVRGDPTVHALRQALAEGAVPFTCQGDLNGLAVEGGETLGWELAASGVPLDRVVVQVGGGALASAVVHALTEARAFGVLETWPRVDTVQTQAAWPLKRAYDTVMERGGRTALQYAVHHRHEFMWPWEQEPHSIAHGILDDETYDWFAVVEGMVRSSGTPVVVGERLLEEANALARDATGIAVDATGSSGLAGLLALQELDDVRPHERVALLFTGVDRTTTTESKGARHAELSRARHPVAEGLRTH